MHRHTCALLMLGLALSFSLSIGQSDMASRAPVDKGGLVEDGIESSNGQALDASGAHRPATQSSVGVNEGGQMHWIFIVLATFLAWSALSIAWLVIDAKRRRRLDPTCYGRLGISYVMHSGIGEVPAICNSDKQDDNSTSVNQISSTESSKVEVGAVLRGRVIWASKEEVLACLGRSLFHEGWRSVRTVDEAASALVVQVLPVEPGRRAALCVWLSSLSAAIAVAVVLNFTTPSGTSSSTPPPPDSFDATWNGALPVSFTAVLLPLLFLVALVSAEAEALLKGPLSLAALLAAVAALFTQQHITSSAETQVAVVTAAVLFVVALWLVGVRARAHLLPLGWWEDPLLPGCKRLPSHPPRRLFPSVEAAARGLLATKRLVESGAARAAVRGVPPLAGADAYDGGDHDDQGGATATGETAAATRCPGKRAQGLSEVEALMKQMPEGTTGLGTWGLDSASGSSQHDIKKAVNPWAMSLDGNDWRFQLVGGPEEKVGFESPSLTAIEGSSGDKWETIAVPGTWQVQGKEAPRYTNIRYPIFHPPRDRAPSPSCTGGHTRRSKLSENPTGLYRRTFEVPPVWPGGKLSQFDLDPLPRAFDATVRLPSWRWTQQRGERGKPTGVEHEEGASADEWRRAQSMYQHRGRRVVLVIKGASAAIEVFVNGVWAGCSKDSFLDCEFDITNALLKGPGNHNSSTRSNGGPFHVLALRVAHWSDGSYLEDQDQWWLSGLHRSVELHCLPAVHFVSLSATTQHLAWASTGSGSGGGAIGASTDGASNIDPIDQQSKASSASSVSMLSSSTSRHGGNESQAKDLNEATEDELPPNSGPPAAAYAICAVHLDIAGLALLVPPPLQQAPRSDDTSAITGAAATGEGEGRLSDGEVGERAVGEMTDEHEAARVNGAAPGEVPLPGPEEKDGTSAGRDGGAEWDLRVWLLPPDADSVEQAVASCALRLRHSLLHASASITTGASDDNDNFNGAVRGSEGVNFVGIEVQPLMRPDPKIPSQQLIVCAPASDNGDRTSSHGSTSATSAPTSADPEHSSTSSVVSVADAHCLAVCSVKVYLQVPAPLLWSAETPHCYSCVASIAPREKEPSPSHPVSSGYTDVKTGRKEKPSRSSLSSSSKRQKSSRSDSKKKTTNSFSPISSKGHVEGCRVGLKEVAVLTAREAGLVDDEITNSGSSSGSGAQVADHKVLCVNRRAIRVRGVNRHEHDGFTGKAMSYAAMLRDAALMKTLHFNAVRCSHYPNHSGWYRLCDEIGLYVVDEANIEAHGALPMGRFAMDSAFRAAMLARAQRMMARDVGHPSIIAWSLGNESGAGPNLLACRNMLKQSDPCRGRPVQYEGGGAMAEGNGCSRLTDIICPMYASAATVMSYAAKGDRPVILCEYAHAMGNSTGGLHLYIDAFNDDYDESGDVAALPSLQGGFIWDWCDQGLVSQLNEGLCHPKALGVSASSDDDANKMPPFSQVGHRKDSSSSASDGKGVVNRRSPSTSTVGDTGGGVGTSNGNARWCWGYGGDFGSKSEQMSDGPFCMNGLVDADRTLHPGTAEVAHLSSPVALRVVPSNLHKKTRKTTEGKDGLWVEVWNKYNFTLLSPDWGALQWRLLTTTCADAATTDKPKTADKSSRSHKGSAANSAADVASRHDGCDNSRCFSSGGANGSARVLASGAVPLPWIAPGKRAQCWVPHGGAAVDRVYGASKTYGAASTSSPTPTVWLHLSVCQTEAPPWAPLSKHWPLVHLSVDLSAAFEASTATNSSRVKPKAKGSFRSGAFPPIVEMTGQVLPPRPPAPDPSAGGSSPLSEEELVVEYDTPSVGYLTIHFTSPNSTSPAAAKTTTPNRPSVKLAPRSDPASPTAFSSFLSSSSLAERARCFVVLSVADGSIVQFVNNGEVLVDHPSSLHSVKEKTTEEGVKKTEEVEPEESMHCLWRAPTDNDCGGVHALLSMLAGPRLANLLAPFLAPLLGWHFRNFEPLRGPTAGASYDQQWRAAGLDKLVFAALRPGNVTVERFSTALPVGVKSPPGRSRSKSRNSRSNPSSPRSPSGSGSMKNIYDEDSASSTCTCVRVTVLSHAKEASSSGFKDKEHWWWQLPVGHWMRRCLETFFPSSAHVVTECKTVIEVHAPTQPEVGRAAPAPRLVPPPSPSSTSRKRTTSPANRTSSPSQPPTSSTSSSAGLELRLAVEMQVASWVPPLPRVGIKLPLPPSFREVDWLGLGPHESYVDRQRASQFGRWHLDVRDQNARVPYARPQEFGGRAGTEWVHVKPFGIENPRHPLNLASSSSSSSSSSTAPASPKTTSTSAAAAAAQATAFGGWGRPGRGAGLLVRASSASDQGIAPAHNLSAPGLQHSVTPYSTHALARADHAMDLDETLAAYDEASLNHATSADQSSARQSLLQASCDGRKEGALLPAPRTWLHVDGFSMGLGGDDGWSPRTHPQYLLQRHKGSAYKYAPRPTSASFLPAPFSSAGSTEPAPQSEETSPAPCGSVYSYELWIGATNPGQKPEEAAAKPARKLELV